MRRNGENLHATKCLEFILVNNLIIYFPKFLLTSHFFGSHGRCDSGLFSSYPPGGDLGGGDLLLLLVLLSENFFLVLLIAASSFGSKLEVIISIINRSYCQVGLLIIFSYCIFSVLNLFLVAV